MSDFKITIMVPMTLTAEDIDGIIETAQDGGYSWFDSFVKREDLWEITHEDVEADQPETFTVNGFGYLKLAEAVQKFFTARAPRVSYDMDIAHTVDVNDADSIVQLAVYDEIVFG